MLLDMATSNEFADVTLVSDDKKQFKAHKIVLSANSPAFKGIISDNPLSNSYIYLRGIQSHELEAILQFIYLGQATIDQERMDEFLDVAKSLEIKEISMKNTENEDLRENEFKENFGLPDIQVKHVKENRNSIAKCFDFILESDELPNFESLKPLEDITLKQMPMKANTNSNDKDLEIKQIIVSSGNGEFNNQDFEQINESQVSYYEQSEHQDSIVGNISIKLKNDIRNYSCSKCGNTYSDKSAFNKHLKSSHGHETRNYSCSKCGNTYSDKVNLKKHMKSFHRPDKYACDDCSFKTSIKEYLHGHIKMNHDDTKYQCDQCNYEAPSQGILNSHIKSVHNGGLIQSQSKKIVYSNYFSKISKL